VLAGWLEMTDAEIDELITRGVLLADLKQGVSGGETHR
jgi:hypothetical protein